MAQRIMEYLIGNANDPRNWGDRKTTRGGVWAALEKVIAPAYRSQFIFMQRLITEDGVEISMYLHEGAGTVVLVDDDGQSYRWLGNGMGFIPISMQEARTRLVGALLDAVDKEVDQGFRAHAGEISHYRAAPKRFSLMPGSRRTGNSQQSK